MRTEGSGKLEEGKKKRTEHFSRLILNAFASRKTELEIKHKDKTVKRCSGKISAAAFVSSVQLTLPHSTRYKNMDRLIQGKNTQGGDREMLGQIETGSWEGRNVELG